MTSVRTASEEIETSNSERALVAVLAVFVSIGAIWAYVQLGHVARPGPDSTITAAIHHRDVFVLRLVLVLGMLGGGYLLLARLRARSSRYLPVAFAVIGAGSLLGLVMAVDYMDRYIPFSDLGPLAVSLGGILLTLAAFAALQRSLAKRVPLRRVRRHECPFCGYPVRANSNCEGCGRSVIGECSSCHESRRVGTQHCGACGVA